MSRNNLIASLSHALFFTLALTTSASIMASQVWPHTGNSRYHNYWVADENQAYQNYFSAPDTLANMITPKAGSSFSKVAGSAVPNTSPIQISNFKALLAQLKNVKTALQKSFQGTKKALKALSSKERTLLRNSLLGSGGALILCGALFWGYKRLKNNRPAGSQAPIDIPSQVGESKQRNSVHEEGLDIRDKVHFDDSPRSSKEDLQLDEQQQVQDEIASVPNHELENQSDHYDQGDQDSEIIEIVDDKSQIIDKDNSLVPHHLIEGDASLSLDQRRQKARDLWSCQVPTLQKDDNEKMMIEKIEILLKFLDVFSDATPQQKSAENLEGFLQKANEVEVHLDNISRALSSMNPFDRNAVLISNEISRATTSFHRSKTRAQDEFEKVKKAEQEEANKLKSYWEDLY